MRQSTNKLLLVKPQRFFANPQTKETNRYQKHNHSEDVTSLMNEEFDAMRDLLIANGLSIRTYEGPTGSPDAIFPNNIFSTHQNGKAFLYPMLAKNRDAEITDKLIEVIKENNNEIIDYRSFRESGLFLEGTGSMVLDRINKIAYAAISPRTNRELLKMWADGMRYKLIEFSAHDEGQLIYHTNIIMFVGTDLSAICLEAIFESERTIVEKNLKRAHSEIIDITLHQMKNMCGNVLELINDKNDKLLIMSDRAYKNYTSEQLDVFKQYYSKILHPDISTIEEYGGGSARCMIAELF